MRGTIFHLGNVSRGPMSEVMAGQLFMDQARIQFLFEIGAVYRNRKRVVEDGELGPEDILRVHSAPKRFSVAFDWAARIVFQDEKLVVVDKPAGIPVHPTLDNRLENVAHQLGLFLGQRLFVTHRLDTITSGLLILAKTPQTQAMINKLFARGLVKKLYRARIPHAVVLGQHTHYMAPGWRAPRIVVAKATEEFMRCELIVKGAERDGDQFLADIELLTGRTHQIRAQLAALGCPLVGDTQYGSPLPPEQLLLRCTHLSWSGHKFAVT